MRERGALAQGLNNEPRILLLDEPFAQLDAQTRAIMAGELLVLWEQMRLTVLPITHDLQEAIMLADRVAVMTRGPGRIKDTYTIDLPRPRGSLERIRFHPHFLDLHRQIWESLRDEVLAARYLTSPSPA